MRRNRLGLMIVAFEILVGCKSAKQDADSEILAGSQKVDEKFSMEGRLDAVCSDEKRYDVQNSYAMALYSKLSYVSATDMLPILTGEKGMPVATKSKSTILGGGFATENVRFFLAPCQMAPCAQRV